MRATNIATNGVQRHPRHPMSAEQPHQGYYPFSTATPSQRLPLSTEARITTQWSSSASSASWSLSPQTSSTWSVHQRQIPYLVQMPIAASSSATPPHLPPHYDINPSPQKPYSSIPLPPQVDPDVSVIPFLRSETGSGLDIDLAMSSRQLGLRGGRAAELKRYLGAPATRPPLPSMTVVHPKLPWSITVHFSEMGYVTVWDVLVTIVESLRLPISPSVVSRDITRRRGSDETRLDYLPGRRLVGLEKSDLGEDVWVMDII